MWRKETFCLNRISRNSPDPEMLMGGWDTLYFDFTLNHEICPDSFGHKRFAKTENRA
jgi:hypothetical protein